MDVDLLVIYEIYVCSNCTRDSLHSIEFSIEKKRYNMFVFIFVVQMSNKNSRSEPKFGLFKIIFTIKYCQKELKICWIVFLNMLDKRHTTKGKKNTWVYKGITEGCKFTRAAHMRPISPSKSRMLSGMVFCRIRKSFHRLITRSIWIRELATCNIFVKRSNESTVL